jgi:hypothetical protein
LQRPVLRTGLSLKEPFGLSLKEPFFLRQKECPVFYQGKRFRLTPMNNIYVEV